MHKPTNANGTTLKLSPPKKELHEEISIPGLSLAKVSSLYIKIPGTKPLVTMSASESNCIPNALCTFSFLAKNPSKKSKNIPRKTNNAEATNRLFTAKITAMLPQNKLSKVIKFGM